MPQAMCHVVRADGKQKGYFQQTMMDVQQKTMGDEVRVGGRILRISVVV